MNMIERLRQFAVDTVRDAAQQSRSAYGDEQYLVGFNNAAAISLACVEERLDTFREHMKSASLPKPEQAIYVKLDDLKSEIEHECRQFWSGSDIDWHPSTALREEFRQDRQRNDP